MARKGKCDRLRSMTRTEIPLPGRPPFSTSARLNAGLPKGMGLGLLAISLLSGCAATTTLPDATPVYAEDIAPGVSPIDVERTSVKRPEPTKVEPAALAKAPSGNPAESVEDKEDAASDQSPPSDKPSPDGPSPDGPSSPPTVPGPPITPPPVSPPVVPPPKITPPEAPKAPTAKTTAPSAPPASGKAEVKAAPSAPAPQKQ